MSIRTRTLGQDATRGLEGIEDGRWWLADNDDELASRIRIVSERTWRQQEFRRNEYAMSWRLYENTPIIGLTPRMSRPRASAARLNKISWNLVKSVVDTYVSLIVKNEPKVSFVTSGGNRTLQLRAKKLEKFIDGIFYENRFQELAEQAVRDSAVFGQGLVRVYADWDNPKAPKIRMERALPFEDYTDEQDAAYGKPQSKQLLSWVDKYALASKYPKQEQEIVRCGAEGFMGTSDPAPDDGASPSPYVALVESWHLPRIAGTKKQGGTQDGRHVISVGNVVLDDATWQRSDFGVLPLYRSRPIQGIWGQSLPVELAPLQVEIGKMLWNFSLAQRRAVGHWLIHDDADVNTNGLDERTGSLVRWSGSVEPKYQVYQTFSPEQSELLNQHWARGFEMVGISQNLAASERPAGLNSGKAQMVYADIQQQRFTPCYREYERWVLDLARMVLAVANEIAEDAPDFEVKSIDRRSNVTVVKWADAHLEPDEFEIQMYSTNKLADDPAARLDYVQESMNAGLMTPEVGKRLTDLPDVEEYNSYEFAKYDYVMTSVDKMLDDGEYQAPDPNLGQDFAPQAIALVQNAYIKSLLDGVEESNRGLLLRWMTVVQGWLAPPPAPAPDPNAQPSQNGNAPAPAPGAAPPGAAPPLSGMVQHDLLRQQANQTATNIGG